jgi:hypothetical protein
MLRTKLYIMFNLFVIVSIFGCAANQNAKMERFSHLQDNKSFTHDKISFSDDIKILFVDIKESMSGDFYKLQFDLINADSAKTTYPVYQIEWLDKDGFVKETTSWKPLKIVGNQTLRVNEMSTVPNVSSYKITISKKEK